MGTVDGPRITHFAACERKTACSVHCEMASHSSRDKGKPKQVHGFGLCLALMGLGDYSLGSLLCYSNANIGIPTQHFSTLTSGGKGVFLFFFFFSFKCITLGCCLISYRQETKRSFKS